MLFGDYILMKNEENLYKTRYDFLVVFFATKKVHILIDIQ